MPDLQPQKASRLHTTWFRWLRGELRREHSAADLRPLRAAGESKTPTAPPKEATADPSAGQAGLGYRLVSTLNAGWYMVEVELKLPDGRADTRFFVDSADGAQKHLAYGLPLRSGKVSKRLIFVPAAAHLRFVPLTEHNNHEITHFRLVRVRKSFAHTRMLKKLQNLHPQYIKSRGLPPPADSAFERIWADYCGMFESRELGQVSYASWIERVEQPSLPSPAEQLHQVRSWSWQPTFSIVLPTFNTDPDHLRACLQSVLEQTYPHWELCIADDASTLPHVRSMLTEFAAQDQRIQIVLRGRNGHIAAASNSALALASGEFVAFLDHDDTLAPHALFSVARALQRQPQAQLVYSDEDKLDESGKRCEPFFKPDWSPDLLYSQNYVAHLCVYQRSLLQQVGGFRAGFDGSQDYDLLLRCLKHISSVSNIVHVPQVLYHWRKAEGSTADGHGQKSYAAISAHRALQEHFNSECPGTQVETLLPGLYRHRWPLPHPAPLVSLIIPTRDGYEHLKTCIDSILAKTTYSHYEILLVDNQSSCAKTLVYMEALHNDAGPVRRLHFDHAFNYSAINNFAAREARGSILGLINNDVEVISPDWLTEMVSHALRPDVGCVGAKLYYPDNTVQHAGVVLGVGGVAGHSHKYMPASADGYFGRLRITHNVSAVTGAALVMRKDLFHAVGELDAAGLHVAFNDVDLCLKVRALGLRNVFTPFAELYHHESKSRGVDETPEKQQRFARECALMNSRWGALLHNDPYYNPNLSLQREDYALGEQPHSN